ncbi:MAG TPA: hypothetical protein DIC42_04890 [Holosporales bacterium]|nr:hypothetical protein [Holosporales bacterium]
MQLPLWIVIPFILLLLSLCVGPLSPKWWHRLETPILISVTLLTIFGFIQSWGVSLSVAHIQHVLAYEYIPFVVLIYTLYTVSTSLKISLSGEPTTAKNALFLLLGGSFASVIGTTGASMLLIYPFLKWNRKHPHKTHLTIFFMLIISNVGGSLTPLGDPPLFIGFLQGVPFEWPLFNLYQKFSFTLLSLVGIFVLCDIYFRQFQTISLNHLKRALTLEWENMRSVKPKETYSPFQIHINGKPQIIFIPLIILVLVFCSDAKDPLFLREGLLLLISTTSHIIDRKYDGFLSKKGHWLPVLEVCRVFFAIFICVSPISLMLQQGLTGPFAAVLKFANSNGTPNTHLYYWMTGIFSAFLDNAPTYLIFFKMIGGSAQDIIQNNNVTLQAVSISSIFFGAMTYIGNAPNFMVRSIAKQHDIEMPSFLGYMGWTCVILLPIVTIVQLLWF